MAVAVPLQKDSSGHRQERLAEELERWRSKLYGWFWKRCFNPEDAQDLTQEVLVEALGSIPRFSGQSWSWPWLGKIARNKLVDYYRKKGKTPQGFSLDQPVPWGEEDQLPELADPGTGTEELGLLNLELEIARGRLGEGLSLTELAQRVGWPVEAVEETYQQILRERFQITFAPVQDKPPAPGTPITDLTDLIEWQEELRTRFAKVRSDLVKWEKEVRARFAKSSSKSKPKSKPPLLQFGPTANFDDLPFRPLAEVLRLRLARGLSEAEIAQRLGFSVEVIGNMLKLGLKRLGAQTL